MRAGIKMDLDQYDKIPCSPNDWVTSDPVMHVFVEGTVYYFKLVPKKCSTFGCTKCGGGLEVLERVGSMPILSCPNCQQPTFKAAVLAEGRKFSEPNPDRFAAITKTLASSIAEGVFSYAQVETLRSVVIAVVEILEEKGK